MTATPQANSTILPPKRRRWRSWLLALLIFIGGAAFGSGITAVAIVHRVRHAIQHPEEAPARITARLKHKLDLTPEQAEQVRAIIQKRQRALTDLRRTVQPRVEAELGSLEEDIARVLTPEQQTRWHAMVGTLRENWLPPTPDPATAPAS